MSSLATFGAGNLLFDRSYSLDIIPYNQTSGATYGNAGNSNAGLRVTFEIERDMQGHADKAKISVTNLSPTNRNAIVRGTTLILKVGYGGRLNLLFTGFVRKVMTEQQGPDVVTSMECGDGEPSITYGAVNRSYTDTVNLARVLQDIASDLKLEIAGNVLNVGYGVIKGIPNAQFPVGVVFEGAVKEVLTRLLQPYKIKWMIQHNKLVILPSEGTLYVSATVVSAQTGMINTPGFNETYMTFQSLLNTSLMPGALLQMQSKNTKVNGYWRVAKCKVQGDTHGPQWMMDCEAEALKQPLPNLPTAQGNNLETAVDDDEEED